MQIFEEILHKRELEMFPFELELNVARNYKADYSFMLAYEILETLVTENDNKFESLLVDEEVLKVSEACGSEHCRVSRKGKENLRDEIEKLDERMEKLEKETNIMKQAFFWGVKEREELMNEIYELFRVLHTEICFRNEVTKEQSSDEKTVKLPEEGRMETGLAQVLLQNPNPLVVIRDYIDSKRCLK